MPCTLCSSFRLLAYMDIHFWRKSVHSEFSRIPYGLSWWDDTAKSHLSSVSCTFCRSYLLFYVPCNTGWGQFCKCCHGRRVYYGSCDRCDTNSLALHQHFQKFSLINQLYSRLCALHDLNHINFETISRAYLSVKCVIVSIVTQRLRQTWR